MIIAEEGDLHSAGEMECDNSLEGEMMNNRVCERVGIDGICADVSDGVGFFPGMISDVSRSGLCMAELPKRLNDKTRKWIVVVSGPGINFKMAVRPKWATETGLQKMVGVEILNTPWAWTEFVSRFESEPEDDIWEINL